ncbi:hypothetical protein DS909_03975 [Phaeobacter gallaeciensis]|uniref:TonB C-terminal domain-containing protein n=1 Tax=Phaeobacter gallaeciensis TaxID=60890 RepID=A0A366X7Q0_9RHOB|nr:TonB family protein [Phaeobacter gallaeciensis]RBW60589.1 hypothetical protein DS909_03975 [Phaeobacter gallaeciensis]
MIPQSRLIVVLCACAALGTHAVAMLDLSGPEPVLIEGSGETGQAALGNSFRDLAIGSNTPVQPTETSPLEPNVQKPVQTKAAPTRPPDTLTHPSKTIKPTPTPVQAPTMAPSPVQKSSVAPTPQIHAPQQTVVRSTETSITDTAIQKPLIDAPRPPADKKKTTKAKPKAKPIAKGNSSKNTRKGRATGTQKRGTASAASAGKKSTKQGDAAASNYSGIVLRKVHRAKRRSVNMRGVARVSFRIDQNGSLQRIAISRSSGSARLDKAALAQIRAATPFPPPPAGAKLNFAVDIKGK